jgi:putative transposase
MARLPRLAIGGWPHHVIQRGHNGQAVFLDDDDRRGYLGALRAAVGEGGVALHAYALLDAEIHLVVTPRDAASLSGLMQKIGRRHAAAFNRRHGRSGSLWEGRYRAGVFEPERYLLPNMRLIETLPVRRGLAASAEACPWSSAAHHLGLRHDGSIVEHALYWRLGNTPFDRELAYRRFLQQPLTVEEERLLMDSALKGWALGDVPQPQAPRRLQPLRRGRPRKE